ncbi:MAG TPA: alpha/beta hydrolase family protein [Bryobacteraceae bacterium]|nr:alpha/beta hydrolase family protein [Bryobacteraceae bacterium]
MRPALLLLVLSAAQAQTTLDVTAGLDGMVDRYLTGIAREQWQARAARIAALRTPAEVKERQAYIRKTMLDEIGGFPAKTALNARITGTLDRADYKVEKLIYESQPRYYVTANVYVPKTGKPPYPAVLGTAGHSLDGKAAELYQRVWIALAKRGFVVLAYDPPGQGERLEYLDPATGKSHMPGGGTGEHTMAGTQCLLTGTSIARYMAWDGIRAFDYLLTRKEVDPARIAVAGNSGGGTQSSYLAVFEPRLAAAAPSCYITSWETLWSGPGPQDAEQNFAGFLRDGMGFSDFLIAFAPKPIQMATAMRDFFPIDGARATYAEARRVFELVRAGDRVGFFEYDDEHGWSRPRREATYRWFAKWLQKRQDDGAEPEFTTEPPANLQVTRTGQVATSIAGAETIQSLNAALGARIYGTRTGAGGKNIPTLVRARLSVPETRGIPAWDRRGVVERQGYQIEKIEMQPEPGITVPGLVFVPSGGAARKSAVLWVNAAGKASDAAEGGGIETVVRAGHIVFAVDPRGWGEGASPSKKSGYSVAYQTAQRAFLTGRTLVGMQTGDVLRAFDYLNSRHDVDSGKIAILGKGNGGVVALYAAALEPRIARVARQDAPASYLDIVRSPMHEGIMDIVVPGVLRDFDLPDVAASVRPRTVVTLTGEKPDYLAWLHW